MTIKGKLDIAFFTLVGIIAFVLYVTYRSNERLKDIYEITEEAQEVNLQLNEILNTVLNIESGQRGFVLTGRKVFLESYEENQSRLPHSLDTLEQLIGNKPAYRESHQKFKNLIGVKIALNDSAVQLKSNGFHAAASAVISSGRGKALMDSIQLLHGRMENYVIRMVRQEEDEKAEGESHSLINLGTLGSLILGSLLIGYIVLRRTAANLLEYQEKQKALISELHSRNAQLDDFAHIVSHNLRSSSSNISGLTGMIDESETNASNKEIFAMLRKVSVNLTETLNDILGTLMIKAGTELPRERLEFADATSRIIESMSADIITKKAEIVTEFEVGEIHYPKVYLESILHNLISNALKYTHPSRIPLIRLKTFRRNGRIVLDISDNGIGIDLSKHGDKIFRYKQVFHQHPQAKGVGLFMVKNQIELLSGSIHISSEVEKGITFSVIF